MANSAWAIGGGDGFVLRSCDWLHLLGPAEQTTAELLITAVRYASHCRAFRALRVSEGM
jgi:hypothetical protein